MCLQWYLNLIIAVEFNGCQVFVLVLMRVLWFQTSRLVLRKEMYDNFCYFSRVYRFTYCTSRAIPLKKLSTCGCGGVYLGGRVLWVKVKVYLVNGLSILSLFDLPSHNTFVLFSTTAIIAGSLHTPALVWKRIDRW